jgi:hypothetical protein
LSIKVNMNLINIIRQPSKRESALLAVDDLSKMSDEKYRRDKDYLASLSKHRVLEQNPAHLEVTRPRGGAGSSIRDISGTIKIEMLGEYIKWEAKPHTVLITNSHKEEPIEFLIKDENHMKCTLVYVLACKTTAERTPFGGLRMALMTDRWFIKINSGSFQYASMDEFDSAYERRNLEYPVKPCCSTELMRMDDTMIVRVFEEFLCHVKLPAVLCAMMSGIRVEGFDWAASACALGLHKKMPIIAANLGLPKVTEGYGSVPPRTLVIAGEETYIQRMAKLNNLPEVDKSLIDYLIYLREVRKDSAIDTSNSEVKAEQDIKVATREMLHRVQLLDNKCLTDYYGRTSELANMSVGDLFEMAQRQESLFGPFAILSKCIVVDGDIHFPKDK